MPNLPIKFRKSPEVNVTVDYFDSITGVGYKTFHCCGSTSAAGSQYFLTTDTNISTDEQNTDVAGGTDTDFDIPVGIGFTVAAEDAIIVSAQHADNGNTHDVYWKIIHVDSGSTETVIGELSGAVITGGAGAEHFRKTTKISLTRKRFAKGDTLRLNAVSTGA